jgi:hypothetical protein
MQTIYVKIAVILTFVVGEVVVVLWQFQIKYYTIFIQILTLPSGDVTVLHGLLST